MELTREEALQYIHEHPEAYLDKARVEGFICPICGSGAGPKGTGITAKKQYPYYFRCWQGCFERDGRKTADIPDIIALKEGLRPGSREALQRAYEVYGITIKQGGTMKSNPSSTGNPVKKAEPVKQEKPKEDFTSLYAEWHKRIGETDYPQKRGLTSKTIERFQLGYTDSFRTTDKTKKEGEPGYYVTWKALIIPNGPSSYTARNLDAAAADANRYRERGLDIPFNLQALQGEKPVFITEGEIDALSVMEVNGEAIALRGKAKWRNLLPYIEQQKPAQPLLLSLDKDEEGRKGEDELAAALKERGIPYLRADITGEHKDANEAYNGPGLADFALAVHAAQKAIKTEREEALEAERAAYMKINAAANLEAFFAEVSQGKKPYSTGFKLLDKELGGGIFEGLTIVGAVTSAGKTTLTMQAADSMARAGHDVLIFSLETGMNELIARSISRETLLECFEQRLPDTDALTTRAILNGEQGTQGILEAASKAYEKYAGNLYIFQSLGKIGTKRIREETQRHKDITGRTPIVVIDYLQLLGQNEAKYSTGAKDIMDAAVTELKCLAVDYKTPVILISSFNRDNYKADANFASFKESGGIEYSADLLLGLQYEGAGKEGFNQEKLEQLAEAKPRKMELKIMKNRNGEWGQRILFDYYAFANYFQEISVKKKGK